MSSQVSSEARSGLNARQAETFERLLTAGAEELRVVGHEALTIRSVATRAGVSPATAYTYLASKNHLFAELFSRTLGAVEPPAFADADDARSRVRAVVRQYGELMVAEPELAAAVTPALLGSDPEVARLRLRIGAEFVRRFELALGEGHDSDVVDALVLAFSGVLLQAGMGLVPYSQLADRLDAVNAVILKGNV
ncbi:TetR/AcrR family transcriptional regulator [Nocardioides sp. Bht2]|uniref:TetR/AcrR family transcriptional regulator n=1 Tax=Nocardioides sp. Bht2 TaxID=3392297 RepID=UPI0039B54812